MREVASYKTPLPTHHITYKDKSSPPKDWSSYVLDPLPMQQLYDSFQQRLGAQALPIATSIRSFLDLPDPLPPSKMELTPDPYYFQRLDHTFTRQQWLPSIHFCRSHLRTGFPSDHFLLTTEFSVKLTASTPKPKPPPRLKLKQVTP
jgi:hypothetical protein